MPLGNFSTKRLSSKTLSNKRLVNKVFAGLSSSGGGGGTLPIGDLIANETFETPTTGFVLSGWTTDVGVGTTVNPAYTVSPISGTQSLRIVQAGDSGDAKKAITSSSEIWVRFQFRVVSVSGSSRMFLVKDNTSTSLFGIDYTTTQISITDLGNNNTTTAAGTYTIGTNYYCWAHWKAGTGANALRDISFSTSPVNPGFTSGSDGASTTSATTVFLGNTSGPTSEVILDNVNVSSTNNIA